MPNRYEAHEPPWTDIDPDIIEIVHLLWRAGFDPCDSGDGHTKLERSDEALDFPHVFMMTERDLLARTCIHRDFSIEASYDPLDGTAVLLLCGVTNAAIEVAP